MEQNTVLEIARETAHVEPNGRLLDFDDYCGVVNTVAESIEAAL